MIFRFLLAILLFATCNTGADGRSASERGSLLQVQPSPFHVHKENKETFEMVLFLGALAFPVILICASEVCRSIRVRQLARDH